MPDTNSLLAGGGGNATAAGVNFQASLGAMFATRLLTERALDERLRLGDVRISSIRFETEAPVDDLLLETTAGGFVFVQAKTTLSLSESLDSEFGKTAEQIVRLWRICSTGRADKGWNRPLDPSRDRVLIAVGPTTSGSITRDLATALSSVQAVATAALPQAKRLALTKFERTLGDAWVSLLGSSPSAADINALVRLVTVMKFDLAGADRTAAIETLSHAMEDTSASTGAFDAIAKECERLMEARHGTNAEDLRRTVARAGFRIRSAPSFQADVEKLRSYSARVQAHLVQYEDTRVADVHIKIERHCTDAVVAAAKSGSLVLVGDPGAGKSAVVSAAAAKLRAQGREVIELAVDRLPVQTLDGLRAELELAHSLRSVLDNWPGSAEAFLFIDALDATRGGKSEGVFRSVIEDVLSLPGDRWRVIASIRTFDLRLGEQFRNLFEGRPPDARYKDDNFPSVRHLHIPGWTETELAEVLARAPAIDTAIRRGGERLKDLALVPFNTRLLADLISGGADAEAFGDVGSQVELLAMYWSRRVESHGSGADLCLTAAVKEMVNARTLQASKLEVAKENPAALDALLGENVLVTLRSERYVAFRHHILFDYAASRLFIDPTNLSGTNDMLRTDQSLGLMLAPALSFTLQELWAHGRVGRKPFWKAIIQFAGKSESNPIARSVAARVACELPETPVDMEGFKDLLGQSSSERSLAFRALSHIVGALTVRIEDKERVHVKPWCYLASEASSDVSEVVWPLRTMLFQLIGKAMGREEQEWLGRASRALLKYSLDNADSTTQIASAAIGFVADTYTSDPADSAALLRRLMTPERMRNHAHEDMAWLARKVAVIAASDPGLAVDIYKIVFRYSVDDTSTTSIGGGSRILPLTSTRRQDYDMARWSLKEAFPEFLRSQPLAAVQALIGAIEGNVALKHPIADEGKVQTLRTAAVDARFLEDGSHIWAWNPDETRGGNTGGLIKAFTARLTEASEAEALEIVSEMINLNRLAVFWTRMFMVGAKRPEVLGHILWPYATREPVLRSYDTRKDAIDLIAATYAHEDQAEREDFERRVMQFEFPQAEEPAEAKKRFWLEVFSAIGLDRLVSSQAREVLQTAPQEQRTRPNRRPFEIVSTTGSPERFWWLQRKGVDLNAPANIALLEQAETLATSLGLNGQTVADSDMAVALHQVKALAAAATRAGPDTAPDVKIYAEDTVSRALEKLAQQTDSLKSDAAVLDDLCGLVESLFESPSPEVTDDIEEKYRTSLVSVSGVRVNAVEAALYLCRIDAPTAQRFLPNLEVLLRDPHPAVRLMLANGLVMLWNTARSDMWRLATLIAREESNLGIFRLFAGFLLRVVHADPEKTEALTFTIMPRAQEDTDASGERLSEAIGSLVTLLWVSHERPRAKDVLDAWLADPPSYENELIHGISSIREGLVLDYGGPNTKHAAVRARCQALAASTVQATATGLERFVALPMEQVIPAEQDRAKSFAKLLDHVGDQFYFASGAFQHGNNKDKQPLEDTALKRAFLFDNEITFRRIGDIGTPHTIYHLIELLQFLVPADPERVFDLVAHALLNAGRKHGFQMESLGAGRFVELIGLFLADHRSIFLERLRREQLVACLDVFVEVGWPAARRLLYRLPELLQ